MFDMKLFIISFICLNCAIAQTEKPEQTCSAESCPVLDDNPDMTKAMTNLALRIKNNLITKQELRSELLDMADQVNNDGEWMAGLFWEASDTYRIGVGAAKTYKWEKTYMADINPSNWYKDADRLVMHSFKPTRAVLIIPDSRIEGREPPVGGRWQGNMGSPNFRKSFVYGQTVEGYTPPTTDEQTMARRCKNFESMPRKDELADWFSTDFFISDDYWCPSTTPIKFDVVFGHYEEAQITVGGTKKSVLKPTWELALVTGKVHSFGKPPQHLKSVF